MEFVSHNNGECFATRSSPHGNVCFDCAFFRYQQEGGTLPETEFFLVISERDKQLAFLDWWKTIVGVTEYWEELTLRNLCDMLERLGFSRLLARHQNDVYMLSLEYGHKVFYGEHTRLLEALMGAIEHFALACEVALRSPRRDMEPQLVSVG